MLLSSLDNGTEPSDSEQVAARGFNSSALSLLGADDNNFAQPRNADICHFTPFKFD